LKQQANKWANCIKIGVCSKINACYIFVCIFFRYAKTRPYNFCRVVRQHAECMVGNIIRILLEIYFYFHQWKNFENPLRIDKVITVSLVYRYYFFWDTVYIILCSATEIVLPSVCLIRTLPVPKHLIFFRKSISYLKFRPESLGCPQGRTVECILLVEILPSGLMVCGPWATFNLIR